MSTFATDVSPVVADIETAPLENARDYIEPPDVSDIEAPSNYKDPVKIAAYIEEAKTKRLADFERDCTDKAALDFNCARIVAIGAWTAAGGTTAGLCRDEQDEHEGLTGFWRLSNPRLIVGFRVREFDLPMLIQRSRYLGVQAPSLDLGRFARGSRVVDLYDLLTFNDLRGENVMRRTAKSFARRFGIPVTDTIDGKEIPALVAAGAWDKVEAHVRADVEMEVALAKRLGVLRMQPEPVEAVAV